MRRLAITACACLAFFVAMIVAADAKSDNKLSNKKRPKTLLHEVLSCESLKTVEEVVQYLAPRLTFLGDSQIIFDAVNKVNSRARKQACTLSLLSMASPKVVKKQQIYNWEIWMYRIESHLGPRFVFIAEEIKHPKFDAKLKRGPQRDLVFIFL